MLLAPDHLHPTLLDPLPVLIAAAAATTRLRVGTFVINNDLQHPAQLAREVVSVDVVSSGRFELGIGAGHMRFERKFVTHSAVEGSRNSAGHHY
jgi:alkanesulfonate monooxygenase SsuD/methylene tetrahydromethanopterin reductase-like flavin-dependent oxidoreductase (luciferase family)